MTSNTLLWLVVNPASGSNDESAQQALVDSLTQAGFAPDRLVDITKDPDIAPAALDAAGVATLAVFTGDGTVSSVIAGLGGWRGNVLVLPGGTTNLLAKALHGEDVTLENAVEAFARGALAPVQRSGIAWSGGLAVCELLAGPGATWSDVREELREGNLVAMAQTAVEAARQSGNGALVRLCEPDIGKAEGYGGVRLVPEAAGLVVDGYGAESVADYLKQGLALLRRNFREGPHDQLGAHLRVHCQTANGAAMDLMVDGERMTGKPEETFSLAPLPVNLLAPVG
ncbi:diacylglycerol kinase family protein [Novosphingobium sp.]|uniref:diacylglycerol/lipid kinase family protein n=1 Tax=Novosphingobium sp. TaxID=1874826 RepID=UPI00286CCB2C|nr:diacylglycerol kinase family protein [Novosphingobium sp.]